jgi:hypothetical protein
MENLNFAEQLRIYLDSEEGQEFIRQEQEKNSLIKNHYDRYSDKLYSLSKEQRNELFEKIKNKYESNEYYFRWMNRGIMPEKMLYHYIYEYGAKYGLSFDELNHNLDPWLDDGYIIDDWIIIMLIGQGTEFIFMPVDEYIQNCEKYETT